MATRIAARYVSRRLSSGGKIFSEEEKAAENIYIKKVEKERLEKLAHQGVKAAEPSSTTASATGAQASGETSSAAGGASTDKSRNYAVIAGVVVAAGAAGWFLNSSTKKSEVQN
ncbi:hypothetical protein ACHQM5_013830 [Ranunculus cassubicifolius]